MPLAYVVSGTAIGKANVNQILDLLTGVMTDQAITIGNDLTAKSLKASGVLNLVNLTSARCVGGWTNAGAPTGLTAQVNDFGWDSTQLMWVCTAAGTPGTWKQAAPPPNVVAGNIVPLGATAAAGSSGLTADASHRHAWDGLIVAGSGTAAKLWIQATDPGASAADGDAWLQG